MPRRRRAHRSVAAGLAVALVSTLTSGCTVGEYRHRFDLVAGERHQPVDVWLRPGVGGGSILVDLLLFPADFVWSTWTCARAIVDSEVRVTAGPLGWLATALPLVSANYYAGSAAGRGDLYPSHPSVDPIVVEVPAEDLSALVAESDAEQRRQRFEAIVRNSLPIGVTTNVDDLNRMFWQRHIEPMISAVTVPESTLVPAAPPR